MSRYPAIALDGAVVLVTGAARGIGLATAQAFAARGARVWLGDRDGDAVRAAAAAIGRGARAVEVDVTSAAAFEGFVAAAHAAHRRLDVLVNNAGVMPLGAFLDQPDALARVTFDVNVWGLVHGLRAALPRMLAQRRGHVVNVASMAGRVAMPGMAMYNASKFAAVGLTAAVRREHAASGVSVSAILPGAVRTALASGVPLGRGLPTVDPEDVAAAIVHSCATRRAQIAVPGYLGALAALDALLPEAIVARVRGLLGERRALTSIDAAARGAYDRRVAEQAAGATTPAR